MIRRAATVSAFVLLATSMVLGEDRAAKPERIGLWNGHAPIGDGTTEDKEVWITVHRPERPNGTAIVICPGGGYGGLVTGGEGHGIAAWLNKHGVTGVVLEYRLPAGRSHVPLLDAQRAIRTVRARAKEWTVDPARIGIVGFSAGGHLASTAATHFDGGDAKSDDPIARASCRPDFAILVYPVITMGAITHGGSRNNLLGKNPSAELVELFSNEKQVGPNTPPTFLAHALDDKPVPPENSRLFFEALQKHSVPAKYLELPSGGHGLNGYKGPMWDAWQKQSLEWLIERKLLVPTADAEAMTSPDRSVIESTSGTSRRIRDVVTGMAIGGSTGLAAQIVGIGVTILGTPLRDDGIRDVPDVPWWWFAMAPSLVASALVLIVYLRHRRALPVVLRIVLLIAAGLAMYAATYVGLGLLRRDFIGKF